MVDEKQNSPKLQNWKVWQLSVWMIFLLIHYVWCLGLEGLILDFKFLLAFFTVLTFNIIILYKQWMLFWFPFHTYLGKIMRKSSGINMEIFFGIRNQNCHRFWDQGSTFWAKIWDQSWKNIPRYDPELERLLLEWGKSGHPRLRG